VKKVMVNQKTLGQIPIPLLLLRNAAMTAVHQLERSPPGSFKVTDAVKFGIFFCNFQGFKQVPEYPQSYPVWPEVSKYAGRHGFKPLALAGIVSQGANETFEEPMAGALES
jgi:hypothetical protein